MQILAANDNAIARAAKEIVSGNLVVIPTETVYGLGANALEGKAVAKIFEAKNRPSFNPLIVHVHDLEQAMEYGVFDERARAIAHHFWPGPLTIIVPRQENCVIADLVSAGLPTIALRVPGHPVAQALIQESGVPIAAPSANRSGEPSATTPKHAAQSLRGVEGTILAAGSCQVGLESTVLDLSEQQARILRPGAITDEDLQPYLQNVEYDFGQHERPKSPGQLLKHYAPSIPVRLGAVDVKEGEALLAFGSTQFMGAEGGGFAHDKAESSFQNLSETGDLQEAAANLFTMLRDLDNPENAGIAVMSVPDVGLGIAINDRLSRAAAASK